jgi:trigger factor
MQVSVEITSGLGRRLTIGVPAERVEAEVAARLEKAARQVRLKGFRQGKVPMKVIKQRFGAGVRQEVLGEVMTQSFYEAVRQEDLRPAGQPTIEPRSMASGRDIEFTASFEVYPDIELVDFARRRKCW